MSNIYADLELPVNARIDFGWNLPKKATLDSPRISKVDAQIAVQLVRQALNRFYYETQFTR